MIQNLKLILASKSPRRQELLRLMGFDFEVMLKDVDESYPSNLSPEEIAVYISEKKAQAFDEETKSVRLIDKNKVVITADTIVAIDNKILGKPADEQEAFDMLRSLSGNIHKVITGVSLLHQHHIISFYDTTFVYFNFLTEEEINYYVKNYQPFDKAGAYGIQQWIGLTAIKKIEGSYTNVVGLPTEKLYQHLKQLSS
jgi:septum formation protein